MRQNQFGINNKTICVCHYTIFLFFFSWNFLLVPLFLNTIFMPLSRLLFIFLLFGKLFFFLFNCPFPRCKKEREKKEMELLRFSEFLFFWEKKNENKFSSFFFSFLFDLWRRSRRIGNFPWIGGSSGFCVNWSQLVANLLVCLERKLRCAQHIFHSITVFVNWKAENDNFGGNIRWSWNLKKLLE